MFGRIGITRALNRSVCVPEDNAAPDLEWQSRRAIHDPLGGFVFPLLHVERVFNPSRKAYRGTLKTSSM